MPLKARVDFTSRHDVPYSAGSPSIVFSFIQEAWSFLQEQILLILSFPQIHILSGEGNAIQYKIVSMAHHHKKYHKCVGRESMIGNEQFCQSSSDSHFVEPEGRGQRLTWRINISRKKAIAYCLSWVGGDLKELFWPLSPCEAPGLHLVLCNWCNIFNLYRIQGTGPVHGINSSGGSGERTRHPPRGPV